MADTEAIKQMIPQAAVEAAKSMVLAVSEKDKAQTQSKIVTHLVNVQLNKLKELDWARAEWHNGGHQTENRTLPMTTSFQLECKRQTYGDQNFKWK